MQLCMRCTRRRNITESGEPHTINYVPNAVKDHYRRLEDVKKIAEIEAASWERSLKLLKEKQKWNATHIQRVWRGFKSRIRIKMFIQERRLWIHQRMADGHRRTKLKYQIACFFGRGPLLESDMPYEIVMKRVPFWSRDTVTDIIQGRFHCNAFLIYFQLSEKSFF